MLRASCVAWGIGLASLHGAYAEAAPEGASEARWELGTGLMIPAVNVILERGVTVYPAHDLRMWMLFPPAVAPLEARWFPSSTGRFSLDMQWSWFATAWGAFMSTERNPRFSMDLAFFAHWRFGGSRRTAFAVAPGLRIVPHILGYTDGSHATEIMGFVGLATRVGAEFTAEHGGLTHGVYVRPDVNYYGHGVALSLSLEYTAMWRLRKRNAEPESVGQLHGETDAGL